MLLPLTVFFVTSLIVPSFPLYLSGPVMALLLRSLRSLGPSRLPDSDRVRSPPFTVPRGIDPTTNCFVFTILRCTYTSAAGKSAKLCGTTSLYTAVSHNNEPHAFDGKKGGQTTLNTEDGLALQPLQRPAFSFHSKQLLFLSLSILLRMISAGPRFKTSVVFPASSSCARL